MDHVIYFALIIFIEAKGFIFMLVSLLCTKRIMQLLCYFNLENYTLKKILKTNLNMINKLIYKYKTLNCILFKYTEKAIFRVLKTLLGF